MTERASELTLQDVQIQVLTCNNCGLSNDCRAPIPMSSKGKSPRYVVLGEAPGQVEDRKGEPFIGPSGMFLRRSLRHAGLRDIDGIYINAVSCFPALRKTPTAEEVQACRGNLKNQLQVADPSYVLVTGTMALTSLLPHAQMMYAQGVPIKVHDKIIFPVYHPSYILRSRNVNDGWQRQLQIFATMVKLDIVPEWSHLQRNHCLYCNRGREVGHRYTCHAHHRTFNSDSVWKEAKQPKPEKLRLFD